MSRSEKKRFHKQFETLLRTKGENCSGCGRAFRRNERAHGGFTRSDRVALVGECCKSMLMVEYVAGVFSSQSDPSSMPRSQHYRPAVHPSPMIRWKGR